MTWHEESFLALDIESTGTDPWTDRIVTASLVEVRNGKTEHVQSWLLNPGVPIPVEAEAVHGISTLQASRDGVAPELALEEITSTLAGWLEQLKPVVAFNAAFDLTMLETENQRHGVTTLTERVTEIRPVIDPLIVDKHVDTYRRGKRTLTALTLHYGVALENAHSATADAEAAALLVPKILERFPDLGDYSLGALHDAQKLWQSEQQRSLAAYFERQGNLEAAQSMRPGWPTSSR